jgi:hypothetical protein
MKFYAKPVAMGRPADAYCVECDAPMTRDEAALNYKLVDKKTTHILCPACLGRKMELTPDTLRGMIDLFRKQGCVLFTPWVEE